MALSLNGSTGISGINGSAGTPALQGGDADTGIFFGTDTASIATAGSERLIVDASGNINVDSGGVYYDAANNLLGIGTTSPASQLDLQAASGETKIILRNVGNTVDASTFVAAEEYTGGDVANLKLGARHQIVFYRNITNETARIDSSGRLLVGTSTGVTGTSGVFPADVSRLQILGNSTNDAGGGSLVLGRKENTASVSDDDALGQIIFTDAQAGQYASINAWIDSTPGSSDYPGRLVFSTTADGASSPTERMRIESTGTVDIAGECKAGVFGTTSTYIGNYTANTTVTSDVMAGGTYLLTFSSGGIYHTNGVCAVTHFDTVDRAIVILAEGSYEGGDTPTFTINTVDAGSRTFTVSFSHPRNLASLNLRFLKLG